MVTLYAYIACTLFYLPERTVTIRLFYRSDSPVPHQEAYARMNHALFLSLYDEAWLNITCMGAWEWVELNLKQRGYFQLLAADFHMVFQRCKPNPLIKRNLPYLGRPRYRYGLTFPYVCRYTPARTGNNSFGDYHDTDFTIYL